MPVRGTTLERAISKLKLLLVKMRLRRTGLERMTGTGTVAAKEKRLFSRLFRRRKRVPGTNVRFTEPSIVDGAADAYYSGPPLVNVAPSLPPSAVQSGQPTRIAGTSAAYLFGDDDFVEPATPEHFYFPRNPETVPVAEQPVPRRKSFQEYFVKQQVVFQKAFDKAKAEGNSSRKSWLTARKAMQEDTRAKGGFKAALMADYKEEWERQKRIRAVKKQAKLKAKQDKIFAKETPQVQRYFQGEHDPAKALATFRAVAREQRRACEAEERKHRYHKRANEQETKPRPAVVFAYPSSSGGHGCNHCDGGCH
ncbi:hypothetical protein FKW77_004306 [Venturia effusa]|uniref:Uncharacterized protein n=1 Tax=Venturia effusa TaxID=50376 RepID=A0A517L763_9PEZI|nr:hypothetical protein FKW77_004306 [Venturia effusa]